jgi:transcriptional regulator of arginine metabolism
MASKAQRQHRITEILGRQQVCSQADLVELLSGHGVEVNQATVSRDLEELGAIKVRVPGGDTVYAIPELPREQVAPVDHLRRVLSDWVVEADRSGDLVVVGTPPGSAHVVASAMDRNGMDGVLGTVAGDDTILVIARSRKGAAVLAAVTELAGLS